MTNRELLVIPNNRLDGADRQRQHLLAIAGAALPCPACEKPINVFEAAGMDVDDYDFGRTRHDYVCPHCQAELEQVVPVLSVGPGWQWRIKQEWLQEQLHKAKLWDQQAREET